MLQLYEVLPDLTFDLNIFKHVIKNRRDGEDVSRKTMKESFKDAKFQRELVRGRGRHNKPNGCLYEENVCKVLQRQVELCGKEDIVFQLDRKECISKVNSSHMNKTFVSTCYNEVRKRLTGSLGSHVL